MANIIIEIIGWLGAVILLFGYFLLTKRKLKGTSLVYHAMNFFGALFIAINAYFNNSFPAAVLNFVWLGIAAYGIKKAMK